MTMEKVLIAATIFSVIMTPIATMLAPSLAEIVKARVNQPTETPSTSQPKDKTKSKVRISGAIILCVCLVSGMALFYLLRSNAPLTRITVLLISVNASAIIVAVFSWILIVNNNRLKALIESEKQDALAQAHIISDSNARRMRAK
jgi:hypothetical protein